MPASHRGLAGRDAEHPHHRLKLPGRLTFWAIEGKIKQG